MIQKPYAAFGYVLIENTYADGEVVTAIIDNNYSCYTFWACGMFKNKNVSTNTEMQDFATGCFLRPSDYFPGVFEHTSVGESKVFCLDERFKSHTHVQLESFKMVAAESQVLPKDTKLFLCAGNLLVNGRNIDQPTQIHIRTGDTSVTAVTDCYGLLFK